MNTATAITLALLAPRHPNGGGDGVRPLRRLKGALDERSGATRHLTAVVRPMNMQQTLKWSMFIGATAGVVYLCALMLQPFLLVIAWSVVLAILFHPLHQRIARKTGCAAIHALPCGNDLPGSLGVVVNGRLSVGRRVAGE